MNAYQPRETQTYGYDNTCLSFDPKGTLIFGCDVPANSFATCNCESSPGSAAKVRQITGKERDSESGLDYFGARYYGSALGRFSSPDESLADQQAKDPQSWNLFSYVRNNPLKNIDPSGLDCITTSNQTSSGVSVSIARGGSADTCSGTFVDGTVNEKSLSYNGSSLSWSDNTAGGGGAVNFVSTPANSEDFGISVVRSVGARTDASYQLLGIAAGGSVALGAGGGAACYYYCEWLADLFGEALTNQEAGNVIGWGKGQANAGATRDLARGLTRSAVETMKRNGLTKNTVKQLLQKYEAAEIKAAANGTANTQLPERIELMRTVLKLW